MPILNNSVLSEEPILKLWRNESELCLIKLKSGDKETFKKLYKLYAPAIYGSIIRDVKNIADSNQILENTFIQAWKNISTFDDTKLKLFTWLLKIKREVSSKGSQEY